MSQPKPQNIAAFYDVDGTLIRTNIVHAFAYYAARQPSLGRSLQTIASTVASIPMFMASDRISRKWFNELFYRRYEGVGQDRLVVLAEDLFEDVIKPNIYPGAKQLIDESKRRGIRQVLITGGLDFSMMPLARYLGVDDLIANRLEFTDDGYATGKLCKPFIAGATKAAIIRDFAAENDIDLARSYAYSDSYSDITMLAVCGRPTAVNADFRLRNTAHAYDWPVIDLS